MLDELSSQEREQAEAIRQEWLGIATCTEPADRGRAEDAVRALYRLAGHEEPTDFVWVSSPLAGVVFGGLAGGFIREVRDPVWHPAHVLGGSTAAFVDEIRPLVPSRDLKPLARAQSPGRLLPKAGSLVGFEEFGPMYRALRLPFDSIWRSIHHYTHFELRALVAAGVDGPPEAIAYPSDQTAYRRLNEFHNHNRGEGQHEGLLPFWTYVASAKGEGPEALPAFDELARAAGFWWPTKGSRSWRNVP